MNDFLAIDFETADYSPDSACAVGLVKVTGGRIRTRKYFLIRPPRPNFVFTYIHGIEWEDVERQPTFDGIWPEIKKLADSVSFIAAHNARFDRSVLYACCAARGIYSPDYPFLCTVSLARRAWNIRPTHLKNVCETLDIPLKHHYALSDAEACARIVMAAQKQGHPLHGGGGSK